MRDLTREARKLILEYMEVRPSDGGATSGAATTAARLQCRVLNDPSHLIEDREEPQNDEEEERAQNNDTVHAVVVLQVHEDESDAGRFHGRDTERHDRVERAEVEARRYNRNER
jgi:hypothetical protein